MTNERHNKKECCCVDCCYERQEKEKARKKKAKLKKPAKKAKKTKKTSTHMIPADAAREATRQVGYVEYSSNNSGGGWWLEDKHWFALERAGWEVDWCANKTGINKPDKDGRWLGALATSAVKRGASLREAVEEWEELTGQSSIEVGCTCCGKPHSFTEYSAGGEWLRSGPEVRYEAVWDD